jgi:hypothetical protein
MGYGRGEAGGGGANAFAIIPEVGIKYVVNGTVNVGMDPFSMPIGIGSDQTLFWYRLNFHGGVNF